MKNTIVFFTLIFALYRGFAQTGAITNIQVEQGVGENERVVTIGFDLTGDKPSYDITLEVSFNDGETFVPVNPAEITGETNVAPGSGIQLLWDGRISHSGLFSEMARIKIIATHFTCGDQINDIDGNVYNTVLLGEQCWMAGNLKTTLYRNGSPIENPTGESDWINNATGAYVWYDNDIGWKDIYGALYNWYAASNTNGLCPIGWHVPGDDEWTQLVNYVETQGFLNTWNDPDGAGNALKSCRQVNSPLEGDCDITEHPRWDEGDWSGTYNYGFDEFGFSAFPGGHRNQHGSFHHLGVSGTWCSSTEATSALAPYRSIHYNFGHMSRSSYNKENGFSVRCLRN
jgi:uncharacterized protein (TIGR02145 family)